MLNTGAMPRCFMLFCQANQRLSAGGNSTGKRFRTVGDGFFRYAECEAEITGKSETSAGHGEDAFFEQCLNKYPLIRDR